jgi:hypothetical protein
VIALLLSLVAAGPAASCDHGARPPEPKLEAGRSLDLLWIERPRPLFAHLTIALGRGLAADPPELPGLAWVGGLVLAGRISRAWSDLPGARLEVEATDRSIALIGGAPAEVARGALQRAAQSLSEPPPSAEEIDAALAYAAEAARHAPPDELLERAVLELVWGHGRPTSGPPRFAPDAVAQWIGSARSRMVVGALGPLERADLGSPSAWGGAAAGLPPAPRAAKERRRTLVVDRPGSGPPRVALVRRVDPDRGPALRVVAAALEARTPAFGARVIGEDRLVVRFRADPERALETLRQLIDAAPVPLEEAAIAAARTRAVEHLGWHRPRAILGWWTASRLGGPAPVPLIDAVERVGLAEAEGTLAAATEGDRWQVALVGELTPELARGLAALGGELEVWTAESLWVSPGLVTR